MEKQLKKKQNLSTPQEVTVDANRDSHSVISMQQVSEFSGPLPHPGILEGYEKILPGSADRILTLAEQEANYRRQIDNSIINTESRDSLLGIIFAFVLSLAFLVCGTIIIIIADEISGTVAGTFVGMSGLGGVITSMINNTRFKGKKDRDKHSKEN